MVNLSTGTLRSSFLLKISLVCRSASVTSKGKALMDREIIVLSSDDSEPPYPKPKSTIEVPSRSEARKPKAGPNTIPRLRKPSPEIIILSDSDDEDAPPSIFSNVSTIARSPRLQFARKHTGKSHRPLTLNNGTTQQKISNLNEQSRAGPSTLKEKLFSVTSDQGEKGISEKEKTRPLSASHARVSSGGTRLSPPLSLPGELHGEAMDIDVPGIDSEPVTLGRRSKKGLGTSKRHSESIVTSKSASVSVLASPHPSSTQSVGNQRPLSTPRSAPSPNALNWRRVSDGGINMRGLEQALISPTSPKGFWGSLTSNSGASNTQTLDSTKSSHQTTVPIVTSSSKISSRRVQASEFSLIPMLVYKLLFTIEPRFLCIIN